MNIEYKFKTWDIENNDMMSWEDIQEQWESEGYHNGIFDNDHYITMQYIGMNDKNDKEIYEGDIVLLTVFDKEGLHTTLRCTVRFGSYGVWFEGEGGAWFMYNFELLDTRSDIEIIGNIYGEKNVND